MTTLEELVALADSYMSLSTRSRDTIRIAVGLGDRSAETPPLSEELEKWLDQVDAAGIYVDIEEER